jgi:transcription elongation factor Elf1
MESSSVEQQLEPYTENPECPKCGSDSVGTRFDAEMTEDALSRDCCDCGYKWYTRCKDYEPEDAYDRYVRFMKEHDGPIYIPVADSDSGDSWIGLRDLPVTCPLARA